MTNKKSIGANEALAIVRAMQSRSAEAQDSINRLKSDVYNIPTWCNSDTVVPLIEKFSTSTKRFDEIINSVNALVDFLNRYIDAAHIGNNADFVELMNSQKIEF